VSTAIRVRALTRAEPSHNYVATEGWGFVIPAEPANEHRQSDEFWRKGIVPFPAEERERSQWHTFVTTRTNRAQGEPAFVPQIRADRPMQTYYSMAIKTMQEMFSVSSGYLPTVLVHSQTESDPSAISVECSFTTIEGSLPPNYLATYYAELTMSSPFLSAEGSTDILMSNVDDESAAGFSTEFAKFRRQIYSFQFLALGWDTYKARPLTSTAVNNALNLLDRLEEARISPDLVLPTSDDSIYFRFTKGLEVFEYELFSDGENVKIKIHPNGRHEYFEVSSGDLRQPV
jgi:hypothetical protein